MNRIQRERLEQLRREQGGFSERDKPQQPYLELPKPPPSRPDERPITQPESERGCVIIDFTV